MTLNLLPFDPSHDPSYKRKVGFHLDDTIPARNIELIGFPFANVYSIDGTSTAPPPD